MVLFCGVFFPDCTRGVPVFGAWRIAELDLTTPLAWLVLPSAAWSPVSGVSPMPCEILSSSLDDKRIFSKLACGRLTDKYIDGTDTPNCRLNLFNQYQRYNSDNNLSATKEYYQIAKEAGLTLAQLACAWVNQQPFVTSNIIGATKMKQLKENIESIDIELDDNTVKKINKIHSLIPDPAS